MTSMDEFTQYYLGGNRTDKYGSENHNNDNFISFGNVVRTDKDLNVKSLHLMGDIEFETKVGRKMGLVSCPSVYTLRLSDFFAVIPSVSVAPTITLPRAITAGSGKVYIIKDISGSASATTITISPQTGETINGDTSTSINTNYGFVGLFTDGNAWYTS